jgi:hypothetical protein
MMRDIDNIKESDVNIESKNWEDEDVRRLWAKNQLIFIALSEFWKPLMLEGKKLMDYLHGDIFDDVIRTEYEEVYGKIPIEPRIMKGRINTLAGQIKNTLRTGKITSEGGMSANEMSTANLILKFFKNEIDEEFLVNEMLFNGLSCCMPQCLWLDLTKTTYGNQMAGLVADVLPWDSFVLEKFFKKADGEDIKTICRVMRQNKSELIEENPNREDAIKDHYKKMGEEDYIDLLDETDGLTVNDARTLYYDVLTGLRNTRIDGKQLVIERLSTLKVKQEIAIQMDTLEGKTVDYQMRPGTWEDERWERWKRDNARDYTYLEKDVSVLWQSRWTGEGLMLQNKVHWFQEHDKRGKPILPIATFVPQIIDGVPTGPGVDMKHKILMKAISETEYLHDVRTGAGDILTYTEGSVVNYQDLNHELSSGGGIVVLDAEKLKELGGDIRKAIDFIKRTPNDAHKDYSEKVSRDLEETDLITPPLMGAHAPRQSAKAKQLEIGQALLGYSIITDNYNKSYMRIKNLQCMLIPYVFTEEQTIQIQDDEMNELQTITLNEKEYDLEGDGRVVSNDLSSVHWRWRLVEGDDSPTQREAELKEMLIFWNTAAPSLIEADDSLMMLSSVLKSMGNKTANKIGSLIEEKAKVKAEQLSQQEMAKLMAELEEKRAKTESDRIKAMRSGFSFSVTAEDLSTDPAMYQILVESGYINETNNNFQLPQPAQMAA